MPAPICPNCARGELRTERIEKTFRYKGQVLAIPDFVVAACPECDETYVVPGENDEALDRLRAFQKEADAALDRQREAEGLLTPAQIKAIRKQFGRTQSRFSLLLGMGAKTFARYEAGMVAQSRTMDHLLRILHGHPELIVEFEPERKGTGGKRKSKSRPEAELAHLAQALKPLTQEVQAEGKV